MAAMRKKSDLPTKICAACGRGFAWRKKWAKVWHEVRYCSDACRKQKHSSVGWASAHQSPTDRTPQNE